MKLMLKLKIEEETFELINIFSGSIEQIDMFTTFFKNKEELFSEIIKFLNIDKDFIKSNFNNYYFSIQDDEFYKYPLIYSDFKFMTAHPKRVDAYKKLMRMDRNRIYEYIEYNYPQFTYVDITREEYKKFKDHLIFKLYKKIENSKCTIGEYYYYFTNMIGKDYKTLRDMSMRIFNSEEKDEINKGKIDVISDKNVQYICCQAAKKLSHIILEKDSKKFNDIMLVKKYQISQEDLSGVYD